MDNQKIHYCFTLSEQQVELLRSKKYKIDRMECFISLVTLAARETKLVPISKIQQVEILAGQCMVDNTQLARLWDKDRKTVPKILEAMEAQGISSSQKVGEIRIHTLHALSGWYIDGRFFKNGFRAQPSTGGSENVRVDVPPARVITIEAEDTANKDTDGAASGNGNYTPATEGTVSSFGGSAIAPPSLPNCNAVDAKSRDDTVSSTPSSDENVPTSGSDCLSADHSASATHPLQEADGKQGEGTQGMHPSWQSGGHQPQQSSPTSCGNQSDGNHSAYNGSNGNG